MAEWPVASLQPTTIIDEDAWQVAGHDPAAYVWELRRRGEMNPAVMVSMPPPFWVPLYPTPTSLPGPGA